MSEFNTTILAGQRVLVTGSKKNQQTILDSTEWDSIKAHQAFHLAGDAFDEAVTAFFAPIVEAAEKANAALAESLPKRDDAFVIVLSEGTEGVEGVEPEVHGGGGLGVHIDEQRAAAEQNAVLLIGGHPALPERLWRIAEHGAAVEALAVANQGGQRAATGGGPGLR